MSKQNVNQNASNVIPFDFNGTQIKVINDDEPWFSAADVCTGIENKNPRVAIKALDDDERRKFNLPRQGDAWFVNESGLFALVLRSRNAMKSGTVQHKFRKWVTSEVLPAIRKTGQYIAPRETLTPDQKRTIQEAVAERATESADFQRIYSKLKTKFRVAKYDEILSSQFEEALAFIESIELKPKGVPAMAGTRWLGHMDHQGQMHMKALEKDSTILPVSKWPDYIRTEHVDESIILDMLKACTAQMDRIVSYQQGKIKELKAV